MWRAIFTPLLYAMAGACLTTLIAWLTNRLKHPQWLTTRRTVIAIIVLSAAFAALPIVMNRPVSKEAAEAALLSQLRPGGTFTRLKEILGQSPDKVVSLKSSRYAAQFIRDLDYVHAVVNKQGNVDAITVILVDGANVRPDHLGSWPYPFGKTMERYEAEIDQNPDGATGVCAIRHQVYLDVFNHTDAANGFERMALGVIDTGEFDCGSIRDCEPGFTPGANFARCQDIMKWESPAMQNVRRTVKAMAFVVTAPLVDLTPDMIRLTYDFASF